MFTPFASLIQLPEEIIYTGKTLGVHFYHINIHKGKTSNYMLTNREIKCLNKLEYILLLENMRHKIMFMMVLEQGKCISFKIKLKNNTKVHWVILSLL